MKMISGKWRLLHDPRKVNAVMAPVGALQPGLPSATVMPMELDIVVIDLKDWFFTIPLDPEDKAKFAFTVPTRNNSEPTKCYHWTLLPQNTRNSPSICQWFVAQALSSVTDKYQDVYGYHDMGDILLAAPSKELLEAVEKEARHSLAEFGLIVAPEKQRQEPWK